MTDLPPTIGDLLRSNAQTCPDRAAIVFPDEHATYQELAARVDQLTRALIALDVSVGECVGLLMHNSLDMVASLFACASVGAICVPINVRNRGKELAYVVADAQMRVLLVNVLSGDYPDLLARLEEALPGLEDGTGGRLTIEGAPSLERLFVFGDDPRAGDDQAALSHLGASVSDVTLQRRRTSVSPDDPAIMLYTSGTTSMPKGCPLLHRQLLSISGQIGERLGSREADRVWDGLPMFHASGIVPMLMTMLARGTFLSQHHFDAGVALSMIESHRATLAWPAFNTIWQELLVHPGFQPEALSSLRAVLCVGPGETVRLMESISTAPLLSCYGITEGIGVPIMVRHDDDEWTRTESGGRPFDGIEAVVRDPETAADLPLGAQRGELWLRGPNVFGGYWHDEQKTRESFDADGWFNTGDLASIDEAGLVYYHGRVKDMLKVGGENVAAVEIEAHLSTHPAVKLAAVVGRPDAKYGEVPFAFIELRPGHESSESELIDYCVGQIASFKVPRHVRFVTEWPMSATKIRKADLREQAARETTGS